MSPQRHQRSRTTQTKAQKSLNASRHVKAAWTLVSGKIAEAFRRVVMSVALLGAALLMHVVIRALWHFAHHNLTRSCEQAWLWIMHGVESMYVKLPKYCTARLEQRGFNFACSRKN